jgi:hypothetical protein
VQEQYGNNNFGLKAAGTAEGEIRLFFSACVEKLYGNATKAQQIYAMGTPGSDGSCDDETIIIVPKHPNSKTLAMYTNHSDDHPKAEFKADARNGRVFASMIIERGVSFDDEFVRVDYGESRVALLQKELKRKEKDELGAKKKPAVEVGNPSLKGFGWKSCEGCGNNFKSNKLLVGHKNICHALRKV